MTAAPTDGGRKPKRDEWYPKRDEWSLCARVMVPAVEQGGMNSLIAVTLWITLVTVIPGLITIAVVFGAGAVVDPALVARVDVQASDWVWLSVAAAVMVLTQAVGIILEGVLVGRRWLGRKPIRHDEHLLGTDSFPTGSIDPYEEYDRLYYLLVRLEKDDDAYGHLERAVAQFFLTNNTLVSFGVGIAVTLVVVAVSVSVRGPTAAVLLSGGLYAGGLMLALAVSYVVAVARFRVLAKSAWSLRTWKTGPGTDESTESAAPPSYVTESSTR